MQSPDLLLWIEKMLFFQNKHFTKTMCAAFFIGTLAGITGSVQAQEYNASVMWGTNPGGVNVSGAALSASMHAQNGVVAGQVNAARLGQLIATGGSGTFQAIGSQTIVSSTITGDSNNVNINATQTSSNSGTVTNSTVR